MRAMAAATSHRVSALLVTQPFDSALLWAAQARWSMCAMAAAFARRATALLVAQAFDGAALGSAGTLVNAGVTTRQRAARQLCSLLSHPLARGSEQRRHAHQCVQWRRLLHAAWKLCSSLNRARARCFGQSRHARQCVLAAASASRGLLCSPFDRSIERCFRQRRHARQCVRWRRHQRVA